MPNGECIFCKIVRKEVPSKIVFENEDVVAFLDINPRSKGMCLVVPKQHFVNFDENFDLASKTFDAAPVVAEKIKRSLEPLTVFISMLPGQVPHFHVRVYPVFKDQIPLIENKPLKVSEEELNELAEKIKSVEVEFEKKEEEREEVKEEVKEEEKPERSKEETFWIRRELEVG